jgi:hypothetical protein
MRLDTRIRHLSTFDLQQLVDRLFGGGAYLNLIRELDTELVKAAAIIRKGTTGKAAQEIADKRLRLATEMQEARRYRKTKLGKLESHYLPVVHHLRTANGEGLSWPAIVRLLKIKYRFTVSVPYLCRVYDGWLQRVQGK